MEGGSRGVAREPQCGRRWRTAPAPVAGSGAPRGPRQRRAVRGCRSSRGKVTRACRTSYAIAGVQVPRRLSPAPQKSWGACYGLPLLSSTELTSIHRHLLDASVGGQSSSRPQRWRCGRTRKARTWRTEHKFTVRSLPAGHLLDKMQNARSEACAGTALDIWALMLYLLEGESKRGQALSMDDRSILEKNVEKGKHLARPPLLCSSTRARTPPISPFGALHIG
ncbi:hypothetical protein EJB05_45490, partial [Eragrostis curvula]